MPAISSNLSCSPKNKSQIVQEKDKYLNMSLEESRQVSKSYVTLDSIKCWEEYFQSSRERLVEQLNATYSNIIPKVERKVNSHLNNRVSVWKGDITKLEIDVIVNAANKTLLGGGGVDGAIHRAAGPDLKEECATLKGCLTGQAKITGGYKLPAKSVVHTVGPVGERPKELEACYKNCLKVMNENCLLTVAFPCISTGIYGYPQEAAAHIALGTIRRYLEQNPEQVTRVVFCVFLDEDVKHYENLLQLYFPVVHAAL